MSFFLDLNSSWHNVYATGFWRNSADVKRIHFAEEWNEVGVVFF
jgi:hypothetical protein